MDGCTTRTAAAWSTARVGVLALLWGATFLWIELALDALSPTQVTLTRCVLGAATLLAVCLRSGVRLPRGGATWARIFVAAFFCNALPFTMFSIGQQTIDSGMAGVLNATTPIWSLLLGLLVGTERSINRFRLAGLLLGFVGTVLIFAPWHQAGSVGWGALAVIVAAASYAIGFTVMGRQLVGRGTPTISLSAAQLCAATGLAALMLPRGGFAPVELDARAVVAVLALGVVSTGITFHLTYRIIADEGATNASTVGYLLPVVSVALGVVVLGEDLTLRIATGMVVVLLGVAMTRHRGGAPAPAAVPYRSREVGVVLSRARAGGVPGQGARTRSRAPRRDR